MKILTTDGFRNTFVRFLFLDCIYLTFTQLQCHRIVLSLKPNICYSKIQKSQQRNSQIQLRNATFGKNLERTHLYKILRGKNKSSLLSLENWYICGSVQKLQIWHN